MGKRRIFKSNISDIPALQIMLAPTHTKRLLSYVNFLLLRCFLTNHQPSKSSRFCMYLRKCKISMRVGGLPKQHIQMTSPLHIQQDIRRELIFMIVDPFESPSLAVSSHIIMLISCP